MPRMLTIIKDLLFKGNSARKPAGTIPVKKLDIADFFGDQQDKAAWFGHSTVLLTVDGKKLLLDPTFAGSPSPFPLIGGKRFSGVLPVDPKALPDIDVVMVSHDHYDHLDYNSVMLLKEKTSLFCVPAGVGKRLADWGVAREKIREFTWWQESELAGLTLVCTPARHFSGRGLRDRNTTTWCSWTVIGRRSRVFYSGDGGYGPHFSAIGEKYGPFDLTFMECGQYDIRWADIHMLPEETAQAHCDLRGKMLVPVHWAAFSLAFHSWTDPIERVMQAARERKIVLATPMIGETVTIGAGEYPRSTWWK